MIEFLSQQFLFSNLSSDEFRKCSELIDPVIKEYNRGDLIYSKDHFGKMIGFIVSGKCEVFRTCQNKIVSLNILEKNASFGITSLFSDDSEFPTQIKALTKSSVMFLDSTDVYSLIEKNHKVSFNIMRFLTNRIRFLNDRIATFSSQNVEKKLASYILTEYNRTKQCDMTFNCKKSAEAISVGRASLYRALESLVTSGCITFESKKIFIKDPIGLERIAK